MNNATELDGYIRGEGIEHFSAKEVLTLRRLGVVAPVPPSNMWPRIIPALQLADALRKELDHPLIIGNGYRPKELNRRAGGSRRSQHIYFRAVDIDLPSSHDSVVEQERFYRAAGRLFLEHGHLMKIGFGLYRANRGTRVHLDCGYRRRFWGGKRGRWVRDLLAEMR